MTKMILLAFLIVAMLTVIAAVAYRTLLGPRARRHAAWELDRAAWRKWMSRP